MRAIIVDDSRFARRTLRGMLEARGIECAEAADGRAGMDLLRGGGTFDLAFVDWNMPVMNGLEMLLCLREQGYTGMKIMVVTTEGEAENIVRALSEGADEYLMKPFDREALDEKLALLGVEEV
jgi:two-component system, chemotaxis family, chemotaxis protein CheY